MKKKYLAFSYFVLGFLGFVPSLAHAQYYPIRNLQDLFAFAGNFISRYVVPLIFGLAFVAFLWGVAQYFFSPEKNKEKSRDMMFYGILALFIMFSVWGLVRIVTNTFRLDNRIPQLQTVGGVGNYGGGGTLTPTGNTSSRSWSIFGGWTNSPSGSTNSPSGGTNSPSGSTNSPSGGTNSPSGSTNSPSGSTNSVFGNNQPGQPAGNTQQPAP